MHKAKHKVPFKLQQFSKGGGGGALRKKEKRDIARSYRNF